MSLVQRRPMPLVGSGNPYNTNSGYQTSRYAEQRPSNAAPAAPRPRPRAMSNSSSSTSRYQTARTDDNRRYYAEQAAPPSSYNRGAPAPPTTPHARSRSQSQSRPRREPSAVDTAETYARTPSDHRHQAQTRPDANTSYSSESSGYTAEQAAPASYGTSIWDRVASAVTNLSVNVGLADSSVLADGERTPPGCESRICVALKDYYITRATSGEDLPDWLFSLEERRAAGGGKVATKNGTMDQNEGDYDDERSRRQGREGGGDGRSRSRARPSRDNGYSTGSSGSDSRPSRDPSAANAAPPTNTSRFKQMRDAKRGLSSGGGGGGGGSLDAGIRGRVPPPNSVQSQTGSYSDGDRAGSYHRSRGPPYQSDPSRGSATRARGSLDDREAYAPSVPAPRPRPTAMGLPSGPRRR